MHRFGANRVAGLREVEQSYPDQKFKTSVWRLRCGIFQFCPLAFHEFVSDAFEVIGDIV
jgi:hypothetical protein